VNTAALLLAQWKASKISIKDDNIALVKRWLRVTFILFPVLGITWVFGFFYVGKHFEIAGYLFTVFNSFQGFLIFVFHCLMDKKARNMVIASFKKKTASVNTGSSGTQKKSKGLQVFFVEKAAKVPLQDKKDFKNISELNNSSELTKSNFQKRDWKKWKKPWSFCFDMPVSENNSQGSPVKDPSKAIVVCLNSVNGRNCQ
ncbi:adhesion G protein-coupled receptor L1-like, partial [Uloborus diversus]